MIRHFWVAIVLALASASPVAAQVLYGSITGVVHDSAGGVVPGATVKILSVGTAQQFTTLTNDVGSYTFPNLPPGTYDLAVNVTGFSRVDAARHRYHGQCGATRGYDARGRTGQRNCHCRSGTGCASNRKGGRARRIGIKG